MTAQICAFCYAPAALKFPADVRRRTQKHKSAQICAFCGTSDSRRLAFVNLRFLRETYLRGNKKGGRSPLSIIDLIKPYLLTTKRLLLKPLAVLVTTVYTPCCNDPTERLIWSLKPSIIFSPLITTRPVMSITS